MKNLKTKSIAATLGAVVVGTASLTASAEVNANPFAFTTMSSGYQLDAAEGKCGEGKCGEGKCRSEANTSEIHSPAMSSYDVNCLKKNTGGMGGGAGGGGGRG
ncbi:hypothetical protein CWB72_03205, partial [Pseudoalteromonas phenolica]